MYETKTDLGREGESLAESFITDRGFTVLCRNYRAGRYGEIDIVGRKDDLVVFFEIRTRRGDQYGGAIRSISSKKIKNLRTASRHYLANNSHLNTETVTFRYDMVTLQDSEIEWIEDIIR